MFRLIPVRLILPVLAATVFPLAAYVFTSLGEFIETTLVHFEDV